MDHRASRAGQPLEKEFYIPHKGAIREHAETTKMRIVYDASARGDDTGPSQLWKVLVHGRFHAVVISRGIRKAFRQVRICEDDRDLLPIAIQVDRQTTS